MSQPKKKKASQSYAARAARGRPLVSLSLSSEALAALDELAAFFDQSRGAVVELVALHAHREERLRLFGPCSCGASPSAALAEHAATCDLQLPLPKHPSVEEDEAKDAQIAATHDVVRLDD